MSASLAQLFAHLRDEAVDYVVIGGMAAIALGVSYVTQDVDLCYNLEPGNLARLARALGHLHPRLRVEGLSDAQAQALPFRLDERTLRQSTILTLQTDVTELDLLQVVPGIGDFAEVKRASVTIALFGGSVLVLDLPGLIASKRAAGRPKDLLALPQIEATLRLRSESSPPA
ncbi:MAG: hypothetical protein ACR2PL_22510 [Dehalococcoidia bacterium]